MKLFIVQVFLTLSVASQLKFSNAEVISDESVKQHSEKILKETFDDVKNLEIKFKNVFTLYHKRSIAIPKPIPDVADTINKDFGVILLRESLNKTWPKFWKVSRRKECAKKLDNMIRHCAIDLDEEVKHQFDLYMTEVWQKISESNEILLSMVEVLRVNREECLSNCSKNIEVCQETTRSQRNNVRDILEKGEKQVNSLEENFKSDFELWLHNKIYANIIPSIENCVDK